MPEDKQLRIAGLPVGDYLLFIKQPSLVVIALHIGSPVVASVGGIAGMQIEGASSQIEQSYLVILLEGDSEIGSVVFPHYTLLLMTSFKTHSLGEFASA